VVADWTIAKSTPVPDGRHHRRLTITPPPCVFHVGHGRSNAALERAVIRPRISQHPAAGRCTAQVTDKPPRPRYTAPAWPNLVRGDDVGRLIK